MDHISTKINILTNPLYSRCVADIINKPKYCRRKYVITTNSLRLLYNIIVNHIIMFLLDIDGVLKLGKTPIAAGVAALKVLED